MSANARYVDPVEIVQRQLDAYNARDIHAFMMLWADEARYFEHPSKLLASGAAEIRERHMARFTESNLFGRLVKRMVVGNKVVDKVVDQEVVTLVRIRPGSPPVRDMMRL